MKVLVIDDDPIVSRSLVTILEAQADIEVTGSGTDGDGAVTLFFETHPDVRLRVVEGVASFAASTRLYPVLRLRRVRVKRYAVGAKG